MTTAANGSPLVSVIVPVYNGEPFLAEALTSVLEQTYRPIEVIVVDDGSTDASAAVVGAFPAVQLIKRANSGVAAARNAGVAEAHGEFIAFLDQDDLWIPAKVEQQVAMLSADPGLDYVLTLQRRFLQPGTDMPRWVRPGTLDEPIKAVDPSTLMVRRSSFEHVGPFASRFVQSSDSDWFFRATDAGLKSAFVLEALTLRRVHKDNNSRFVEASQRDLRRIVMESIRRKRAIRDTAETIRASVNGDRLRTRRMLAIDARVLTPNRDGGSLRMFSLLRIFRQRGLDVSFVPSFPQSFLPFSDSLTADSIRLQASGIDLPANGVATVEEHLERAGREYDIVLMTGAFVASRHLGAVRRFAPQATLVFDTIDLHYLREYRAARLTGNVPRLQSALKLKQVELQIARTADVTLVVSEREQAVLQKEDPLIRTWVVPNVHEARSTPAVRDARRDLMFLGAFTFDPNVDAMTHFVRQTLPAIRHLVPGVRLHIVGSDPTPDVLALSGDDVVVAGYVDDLAGHFDRCRVFVAPLRFGAGIKGKLLFSMAHGLPAVVSPVAAEGIPAVDGRDLLVAQSPAEWSDAVLRLHRDDVLWSSLSDNGRALVAAHYSFAAVGRCVDGLLDLIGRDRHREVSA